MSTISARLKVERLRLGLTQEEMAKAGGVARSAQANYEKGDRSPDSEYLAAIAKIGSDVGFIITGTRIEASSNSFDARSFAVGEKFQKLDEFDRQCIERFLSLLISD